MFYALQPSASLTFPEAKTSLCGSKKKRIRLLREMSLKQAKNERINKIKEQ
jgi:hypothetical protein